MDIPFKYHVKPNDYIAAGSTVVISENGRPIQYLEGFYEDENGYPINEKKGTAVGTIGKGVRFDLDSSYTAQVFLNSGTGVEIKSEEIELEIIPLKFAFKTIKGLYKKGGIYDEITPYTSDDNKGRIYSNREFNPSVPEDPTWKKDTQYIDLEVVLDTNGKELPEDMNIYVAWEFEDPDDPTDNKENSPDMHEEARKILDKNDYDGVDADGIDNDMDGDDNQWPPDKMKTAMSKIWEKTPAPDDYPKSDHPDYVGNILYSRTEVNKKVSEEKSAVRFNVAGGQNINNPDDIVGGSGDNYKVKATLMIDDQLAPTITCETGIMTVWKKINVEYTRMEGSPSPADPADINKINEHYEIAFVEFNCPEETTRNVEPEYYNYENDGEKEYWAIGLQDDNKTLPGYAPYKLNEYISSIGKFSKEGEKGWYFMGSAHDYIPLSGLKSLVLFPRPEIIWDIHHQTSNWAFGGRKYNDYSKLYVNIEEYMGATQVEVYADPDHTRLIARGSGDTPGIVLEEVNIGNRPSGLYGYVEVINPQDDNNIMIKLPKYGTAEITQVVQNDSWVELSEPIIPSDTDSDGAYQFEPSFMTIFNEFRSKTVGFIISNKSTITNMVVKPHIYSPIDDPNVLLPRTVTDHNFTLNQTIDIRIDSPGAYGTAGANGYIINNNKLFFNGRVLFFSGFGQPLTTQLHEMGHALGFAHRCGNLDFNADKACFMGYGLDWLMKEPMFAMEPGNRKLVPWSNGKPGFKMCPHHCLKIRETNLAHDNKGRKLQWGN